MSALLCNTNPVTFGTGQTLLQRVPKGPGIRKIADKAEPFVPVRFGDALDIKAITMIRHVEVEKPDDRTALVLANDPNLIVENGHILFRSLDMEDVEELLRRDREDRFAFLFSEPES